MRDDIAAGLDKADKLDVGAGSLDAFMWGRGDLDSGAAGVGVDYSHRISEMLSAFAQGQAGYRYGVAPGVEFSALGGLRWRF